MWYFADTLIPKGNKTNAKKCRWAKAGHSTQCTHPGPGLHIEVPTGTDVMYELASTAKLRQAPQNAKVMKVKVV